MNKEFGKTELVRYLETPHPNRNEWHTQTGDFIPISFNIAMESALSIIYDRFRQYAFLNKIGATPMTILSYCTYRFWAEEMQAPLGHIHDDVWCVMEEDVGTLLDSRNELYANFESKSMTYLQAIDMLVNEVYPFFTIGLDAFMKQHRLYGIEDMDLDVAGLMGYVVNFTLLKPTEG